ncbi:MAG TPA: hypothetical protein VD838_14810, partial [Anaeromyxobacteraceae bacterium]|nr:hypothetical protein [Anaeromyxobacteraceae bacterium]
AEMHNRHHTGDAEAGGPHGGHGHHHGPRGGMGEGGMGPGGRGDGPGMAMPPPSRATVEELPDGARVVVTPEDPAELQRLQTTVRSHAEHMQQHGCAPMRPMRSMRRGS